MSERQTWYVTKYWEVKGVEECEGYLGDHGRVTVTLIRGDKPYLGLHLTVGRDIFDSVMGAQFRVIELAERKLKSLDRKRSAVESILEKVKVDMQSDAHERLQERLRR